MPVQLFPDDVTTEIAAYRRNVERLREERRWSHEALARRMGVSTALVTNFEAHRTIGSLPTLIRFANALGVDIGELFKELPQNRF